MSLERLNNFPEISGMDDELDFIGDMLDNASGQLVTGNLPELSALRDFDKVLREDADGKFYLYMKFKDSYYQLQTDGTTVYFTKYAGV